MNKNQTWRRVLTLLCVLTMLVGIMVVGSVVAFAAENDPVAKVGNTEYATIDEAIANWTNGSTLTLLADVTLTKTIELSSTEYHILDLGTYTMTAASRKDAIQIVNNGRSSASYALDIKADATNPGGITASGKAVVKTTGKSGVKDRPIIRFYGGVFTGTNVVYHSGSNGTNCPQFWFYGGEFNGTIYANRALFQFYGGTFNGNLQISVDSSAYALVSGGRFKKLSNLYGSSLNSDKFTIGSAKGKYDRSIYIDAEGYYVVTSEVITEVSAKYPAVKKESYNSNNYFYYSLAATNGMFYQDKSMAGTGSNVTIWEKPAVTIPENVTGDTTVVEEIKNNTALKDYKPENLPTDAVLEIELVSVGETIVYDVTPMVGDTKVEPTEAITFRLPVPASVNKAHAKVYHKGTLMGIYEVKGEGNAKYVEVSSADFSQFAVEPTEAAAKIGEVYYETVQAAINAAQNGNTVTILPGEYGAINISNKNIIIQGTVGDDGELLTTIKGGNPAITGHGFNGTIKDLKIVDAFKVMYAEPAGNVTVNNVYVTGATYGFHLVAYSQGLTWTIQNSYMDLSWANSFGVYGDGDAAIVIENNEFAATNPYYPDYGALAVNTFLPNVTVTGNIFGENAKILVRPSITDTSKIDISKNYHADGVENAFVGDSAPVDIYEYYTELDTNGDINTDTLVDTRVVKIGETYYTTLQAAINAVQNGQTITLLADVTGDVTLTENTGLYYTIDGDGKKFNGTITVNSLSDTNDNRRITIKNVNFVTDTGRDFITSTATNHYPRLTVEACSFTGTGNGDTVAIRLKSSHSVVIKDCTGTRLHSFLQNTSGWNLTVENVTVTDSKSGLALGTVQGVTVKDCDIDVAGYGIRLDAQYNNDAVLESNTIEAFIPVVVRKTEVSSTITVQGDNAFTATNTDGLWLAIGASEYETNGSIPTDATGKVVVTLNDITLNATGISGNYGDAILYIYDVEDLKALRDAVNSGENYFEGVTVYLAADIDLAGENWVAIGSAYADHGFMGNFDGNGFKIKNLTINNPALDSDGYAYAGFFGVTEGIDKDHQNFIKDLVIKNVTIETSGHIVAAAIAYPYYTALENITVCGDIAIKGGDYTAGALAYTRRCVDAKNVTVAGNAGSYITGAITVGGVISDIQMNGGLTASYSNFSVSGVTITGNKNVGGISGIIARQTLNGATVKNVTLVCSDAHVGIVAGSLGDTSTIKNIVTENVTGATATVGACYDSSYLVVKNGDAYTAVAPVAEVNGVKYATLADAIAAAQDGDVVTLLANVTENVTINKGIIIDGADKNYTGTMTLSKTNVTIHLNNINFIEGYVTSAKGAIKGSYIKVTNCDFEGTSYYALSIREVQNLTVENCTAKNFSYGFIYVPSAHNTNVVVKNTTIENVGLYGVAVTSGCAVDLTNVTIKNSLRGIHVADTAVKSSTITNCTFENVTYAIAVSGGGYTYNVNFVGVNDLGNGTIPTAANVKYTGVQVGNIIYSTLADAFANVKNGDTIKLLGNITVDTEKFTVPAGVKVTLDLNGKKITAIDKKTAQNTTEGNYELFYINGGELVVTGNGTIELTATTNRYWKAMSTIFHNRGGVLTIENGTFTHNGVTDMAFVVDNSGNYSAPATTNIYGGKLHSTYTAIRNRMDKAPTSFKVTVNVYGGEITGGSRAIWAQASSSDVNNPASGAINIYDGEIGFIYTSASAGAQSMTTITGGTVASFKGESGELTVNGGEITGDITILFADGTTATKTVVKDYVYYAATAWINKVGYFATLADAVEYVNNANKTSTTYIYLICDSEGPGFVVDAIAAVQIEFEGYTYTITSGVGSTGTESNGIQQLNGKLVLRNGTLKVAGSAADKMYILVQSYDDLSVIGMTLDGTNLDKWSKHEDQVVNGDSYVISKNNGNFVINTSNIITNDDGSKAFAFDLCDQRVYGYMDLPYASVAATTTINGAPVKEKLDKVEAAANYSIYYYATIEQAIAKHPSAALIGDVVLKDTVVIPEGKTFTLDLNGHTITMKTAEYKSAIVNNGTLTIKDSGENGGIAMIFTGTPSTAVAVNTISNRGKLTVQGGNISNTGSGNQIGYAIDNYNGATLTVKGGNITASGSTYYDAIRLFCGSNETKVTVSGGYVSSIWAQNPTANKATEVKGTVTVTGGTIDAIYYENYTTVTITTKIAGNYNVVAYGANSENATSAKSGKNTVYSFAN